MFFFTFQIFTEFKEIRKIFEMLLRKKIQRKALLTSLPGSTLQLGSTMTLRYGRRGKLLWYLGMTRASQR